MVGPPAWREPPRRKANAKRLRWQPVQLQLELQDDGGTAATASSQEHGKGWLKVVRDRGKLRYRDEEADATAMHGAREPETTARYRTTKRAVKQEPLPKNDYKIIMKPTEGRNFAKWSHIAIARSLSQASELPIEAMRGRVIFRVQHDQNTVIISTAYRTCHATV